MANKKDSYWFRHDTTAGRGLRLKKIQHIFGHWGKGIYWDVIEILREQSGYKYENSPMALQLLCDLIGEKNQDKFAEFFAKSVEFSLFKIKGAHFYSEVLTKNMKNWESKKTNGGKGGRPKTAPKKNRNETESITETKANQKDKIREDKIREDYIITEQPKKEKVFFTIGTTQINQSPSSWFQENYGGFYEQWEMKNSKAKGQIVFERMDQEYFAYTFMNLNHVQRTFVSLANKTEVKIEVAGPRKRNQNLSGI